MGYDGGGSNSEMLTEGPLFLQVRRLCGQDPRQSSTDGDRHECEALYGAPVQSSFVFGTKTHIYALSLARFTYPPSFINHDHQNRTLSMRLVRDDAPSFPFLGNKM